MGMMYLFFCSGKVCSETKNNNYCGFVTLLLSPITTRQDETVTTQPTRSSGQKPAKVLEVTIPLRTQTYPTLVTGKTAEKCDNAELSGQSDLETSPKKSKSGS